MCCNKVKGASGIEYFIVIILLISFLIIGVVIASSVFHFAIFPAGRISSSSGSPLPCSINVTNISNANNPNTFKIEVSDGSLGLVYKIYMNNVNSSNPSNIKAVGNYTVGINSFSKSFQIKNPGINTIIIGNTTGSNVSIDGVKYTAGGQCESEIYST